jgi:uncharacterized protein (DUF1501 family)
MKKNNSIETNGKVKKGLNRRSFLKRGVTFVALSLASRHMMMQVNPSTDSVFGQASSEAGSDKLLVIVQLSGGNDGLNTVVPYGDGIYYDSRPNLAVPESDVLVLDDQAGLGFNPNLQNFKQFYDDGKMAIINGVGYPNSNRSHFRSTDIWMSGHPDKVVGSGWIGRYLDHSIEQFHGSTLPAGNVRGILPLTLKGDQVVVPSIQNLESYNFLTDEAHPEDRDAQLAAFNAIHAQLGQTGNVDTIAGTGISALESSEALQIAAAGYSSSIQYPTDPFGQALQLVSQILSGGLGTQVMHVSIGGFDTHASQDSAGTNHPGLLTAVDGGLKAFYDDLVEQNLAKDVTIMSFSEFGRRVKENGSQGTDHGTAAPMFIIGDNVQGGIYGDYPSLTNLDGNGDLIHTVDFRQVYATVLEDWLQTDSTEILDASYNKFDLFV